jgi:hypothetical protein
VILELIIFSFGFTFIFSIVMKHERKNNKRFERINEILKGLKK